MIKIDFEKTSEDGLLIYRDAIHLPEDHGLTDDDIEAIKQLRFDRWYSAVTNPPPIDDVPVDEPIVEEVPAESVSSETTPVVDDVPVQE